MNTQAPSPASSRRRTRTARGPAAALAAVLAIALSAALPAPAQSAPALEVRSASGSPGDTVTLAVVLHSRGGAFASSASEISLDREVFLGAAGNQPDCTPNPGINVALSESRFTPRGCNPEINCGGALTVVLTGKAVGDGSELYTCRARIAADASPGEHPVRLVAAQVSDLNGDDSYEVEFIHGAVHVLPPAPGEVARESRPAASGGGCNLDGGSPGPAAVAAILFALPLLWLGRRPSRARSQRLPRR